MIEITRSYTFNAPPDRVWSLLMDPAALSSCIPGCKSLEADGEDRYLVTMAVALSAVMGTYTGTVQLVDIVSPTSYCLIAEGQGRPGFVKGRSTISLLADGENTEVTLNGTVQTGGAIARVGQRVIGGAARLMMDRFFRSLKKRVEGNIVDGADEDILENPPEADEEP
jgi:carbon monoxide dehydrogenase subunit G